MMNEVLEKLQKEIEKVIVGKSDGVKKLLLCLLAGGHALLDDIPGVGKTTLALALSKAVSLSFRRVQFTPDVMPSDITGFNVYDRSTQTFVFQQGALLGTNLLLCDEINRTSGKTQSALLEGMEEGQVTVDGVSYATETPFLVVATQNRVGSIGTQPLPYAQMDRFALSFSLGYPTKDEEFKMLKDRALGDPLMAVQAVASKQDILALQEKVSLVTVKDNVYRFITLLSQASRSTPYLEVGISPRACLSLLSLAKANAVYEGRDYVVPQDVRDLFLPCCAHRVVLSAKAIAEKKTSSDVLTVILKEVKAPDDKN